MQLMINEQDPVPSTQLQLYCFWLAWDWPLLAQLTSAAVVMFYTGSFVIPTALRSDHSP
jgi:hypothetical protein